MLNFSTANLIGGLIFGSIGFVAFIYGKRMNLWRPMFLGIALMVYPYFVSNDAAMLIIGIFGSTALFFVQRIKKRKSLRGYKVDGAITFL